ncbi:Hypothetical predicted protein [Cloeon dipterum]|uniref:C2H2-type domain-containing protein n=1 Tax=Cloeon dipterum TaxID=197152 RepID=A0A8S1CRE6_9INSE|nr:Hypothetical predicted protein [Cloeon dipterum]
MLKAGKSDVIGSGNANLSLTPGENKVLTYNQGGRDEVKNEVDLTVTDGFDFSEDDEFEHLSEYIDISEIAAKLNISHDDNETSKDSPTEESDPLAPDRDRKPAQDEWKANWGIKCGICGIVVGNRPSFEAHFAENHPGKALVYQCSYCNKVMDHYTTFRSHRYRHVTEGRYKCNFCNKGFSVRSLLRVHTESKHAQSKPYICETCGKGFGTKPGLKLHMEKHKVAYLGKEWPCNICGKVLLTSSGLKAHLAVHEQGKRFMCELCGKTFTQKVNMQQHLKGHTGEKPYTCHICGKRFAEKSHLNRHCSFHSDDRPFKCDICGKMYKTERCLKVHLMTHKSERPCKCNYCGKGFLSNNKLKQHKNIHTGDRPFKCKFCAKTFTNYPNYLKHTKRRHKEEFAKMGGSLANHDTKRKLEELIEEEPIAKASGAHGDLKKEANPVVLPSSLEASYIPSMQMMMPAAPQDADLQEPTMASIMVGSSNEIMYPVQSGMEVVPLYSQLYGTYQENYNAMPL